MASTSSGAQSFRARKKQSKAPCGVGASSVLAASSDTLHGMEQVASVVERLPNATLIEVPSNQYAHEADVLADVEPFYEAVG